MPTDPNTQAVRLIGACEPVLAGVHAAAVAEGLRWLDGTLAPALARALPDPAARTWLLAHPQHASLA